MYLNNIYCLIIWGINYESNLNKICIQQQQIRLINKTSNPIHNIYKLNITLICYITNLKYKIYMI